AANQFTALPQLPRSKRFVVPYFETPAERMHIGLDQVGAAVERRPQRVEVVAGPVRHDQGRIHAVLAWGSVNQPRQRRTIQTPPISRAGIQYSKAVSATAPNAAVQETPIEARPATSAPSRGLAPWTPGSTPATWLAPN